MSKVTLSGKEYTMKDVSILGIKMLGTKLVRDLKIEDITEWIGDEVKEKQSNLNFKKFVGAILVEPYEGVDMLSLPESEVVDLVTLFFDLATPKKMKS